MVWASGASRGLELFAAIEFCPGRGIVGLPIAPVEGRGVNDSAFAGPSGQRVVRDRSGDSSLVHFRNSSPFRGAEAIGRVTIEVDNSAIAVEEGVALILLEDGELDPIQCAELREGEP